jgi:hypothetical protein
LLALGEGRLPLNCPDARRPPLPFAAATAASSSTKSTMSHIGKYGVDIEFLAFGFIEFHITGCFSRNFSKTILAISDIFWSDARRQEIR